MHAFAQGFTVPAQVAFGTPLSARSEFFDRPGHKQSARTAFQGQGGLTEQGFERVGQFHCSSSRIAYPGACYTIWDSLIFGSPLSATHITMLLEIQGRLRESEQ